MTDLEIGRCGLVLMDMQNEIVHPDGFVGGQGVADQVRAGRVIENCARALQIARAAGVPIFHVGMAYRQGYPDINHRAPVFQGIRNAGALQEGSWGSQFESALRPLGEEPIVFKRGVGAFAGTDFHRMLSLCSIETLILAGVATNFVVEATARHAVDEGFRVIVLGDCCATFDRAMHESALVFLRFLGAVVQVADLAAILQRSGASNASRASSTLQEANP